MILTSCTVTVLIYTFRDRFVLFVGRNISDTVGHHLGIYGNTGICELTVFTAIYRRCLGNRAWPIGRARWEKEIKTILEGDWQKTYFLCARKASLRLI